MSNNHEANRTIQKSRVDFLVVDSFLSPSSFSVCFLSGLTWIIHAGRSSGTLSRCLGRSRRRRGPDSDICFPGRAAAIPNVGLQSTTDERNDRSISSARARDEKEKKTETK